MQKVFLEYKGKNADIDLSSQGNSLVRRNDISATGATENHYVVQEEDDSPNPGDFI